MTTGDRDDDDMRTPVGSAEIADRLGVARATVHQWRQRKRLPPPDWTVGGRSAWSWATILAWVEQTGRGWLLDKVDKVDKVDRVDEGEP